MAVTMVHVLLKTVGLLPVRNVIEDGILNATVAKFVLLLTTC